MAAEQTIAISALARVLKLTTRRVNQLAAEGVIPKTGRGRFELAPAVQGYIAYLQSRAQGAPDAADGNQAYQGERTRKIAAEASIAELGLAKARGEVVSVKIAAEAVGDALASCRLRLLGIGAAIAPRLEIAENAAAMKAIVDEAVLAALEDISDGAALELARGATGDDPSGAAAADDEDAQAATEADGGGVG